MPLTDFLGFLSFSRAILVGGVIAVHKRFNVPAVPNILASEFPESSDKDECPCPNKVCLSSHHDLPCANIPLSHCFEQSYMVLELMHASLASLGKRLRRSTAAPSEILLVALQAGGALTAALERIHEHGCLRKCIRHQCCIT